MAEQPQAAPAAPATPESGTSAQGQAASPAAQSGVPNDPAAFQADFTQKYQKLGEERKAVESEKAAVAAEKAAIAAQRAMMQQQYSPQYAPPQPTSDPLVDQFGAEGAAAIRAQQSQVAQGVYQQLFATEYARQEEVGRQKHGEAWSKFDYTDPATGQRGNTVMDLRCKGLSLDQAWNALNPVDPSAIEQSVKDKVYAEMKEKEGATPAPGGQPAPRGTGVGHAQTTEEAYNMAVSQLSGR